MSELIRGSKYRRPRIVVVALNDKDKLAFKLAKMEALEHALTSDIAACKHTRENSSKRAIRLLRTALNSNLHLSPEFFV
jgi:hypothetical protein